MCVVCLHLLGTKVSRSGCYCA